mgnify:CR=1 FL=1
MVYVASGVSIPHQVPTAVHAFVDGQVDALVGRTAFRRYAETGVQADTVARSGDGRVGAMSVNPSSDGCASPIKSNWL